MVVKPIISILTLPLNILTLGLFSIVINGAFFWFVGQIIQGFSVSSFKAAIIGALVISIITWIIGKFVGHDD
jgi:putative membrane protein